MDFLDQLILDNPVRHLMAVLAVIMTVFFLRTRVSRYLASLLHIPLQRKWKSVSRERFASLIIKPLGRFLSVLVFVVAVETLVFPAAWDFSCWGYPFKDFLQGLAKALLILYFIRVLQCFIDFIALVLDLSDRSSQEKKNEQLIVFFRDFVKTILYLFGILLMLKVCLGVDVGALLTGLSIVGAALALAAKESIENLIASFIIFFDKPFFTGDQVKVNQVTGTIEHIGLRSTRIRTADQTLVTVPNKQMVDSIVDNWSMRSQRRVEIRLEFHPSNSTASLLTFMEHMKGWLQGRSESVLRYQVFFSDQQKNSSIITLEYFTPLVEMEEFHTLKQACHVEIRRYAETAKLVWTGQDPQSGTAADAAVRNVV